MSAQAEDNLGLKPVKPLSIKEAAALAGVTRVTLLSWERKGLIRATEVLGLREFGPPRRRYRPEDVLAVVAPVVCECGILIKPSRVAQHRNTLYHNNHRRIHALLDAKCVTMEEIGRRLKITRERVRQLAEICNVKPGERWRVCNLARRETWLKENLPVLPLPLAEKLRSLQAQSWEVSRAPRGTYKSAHRRLVINGKTCAVHVASGAPARTRESAKVRYHRITIKSRTAIDFLMLHIAREAETYIVPVGWLPGGRVVYLPVGRTEGYNGGKRQRDWEQWRENWEQLTCR